MSTSNLQWALRVAFTRAFHAVTTPFLFLFLVAQAQVIQECEQPGTSIARIALNHSLNANLDLGFA
ncbi:hypothetical protein ACDH53_05330 [Pseudomonas tremae]|uniref:Uncharacterized protein n=1 Tax=Pseudomonas tremae TaxID=200454 RepID=A0ABV4PAR1_9PSED|nr:MULTISPECIES: hypothetical protein [Pseudomonas syringae group]